MYIIDNEQVHINWNDGGTVYGASRIEENNINIS